MKLFKILLLLCAVLTGCGSRKAEFLLEENREVLGGEEFLEEDAPKARTTGGSEAEAAEALTATPTPAEIYVDVCGAVAQPGVFKLTDGSRVFQAIEAAGGYLPEAAESYINRAGLLADGQQIYVPTEAEAEDFLPAMNNGGGENAAGNRAAGGKVNINTADEAGLSTLTGIGAAKAKSIISYREAHGAFGAIEDIMKVEGIKEGTFEKIKDDITI